MHKVIENQKTRAQNFDDETDMVDAFVACGGRMDKTGHVKRYDSCIEATVYIHIVEKRRGAEKTNLLCHLGVRTTFWVHERVTIYGTWKYEVLRTLAVLHHVVARALREDTT